MMYTKLMLPSPTSRTCAQSISLYMAVLQPWSVLTVRAMQATLVLPSPTSRDYAPSEAAPEILCTHSSGGCTSADMSQVMPCMSTENSSADARRRLTHARQHAGSFAIQHALARAVQGISTTWLGFPIRVMTGTCSCASHAVARTCQSASEPSGPMRLASSGSAAR